jgi:hypothetical protein
MIEPILLLLLLSEKTNAIHEPARNSTKKSSIRRLFRVDSWIVLSVPEEDKTGATRPAILPRQFHGCSHTPTHTSETQTRETSEDVEHRFSFVSGMNRTRRIRRRSTRSILKVDPSY